MPPTRYCSGCSPIRSATLREKNGNRIDLVLHISVGDRQVVTDIVVGRREFQRPVIVQDRLAVHTAFEIGVPEIQVKPVAFESRIEQLFITVDGGYVIGIDIRRIGIVPDFIGIRLRDNRAATQRNQRKIRSE